MYGLVSSAIADASFLEVLLSNTLYICVYFTIIVQSVLLILREFSDNRQFTDKCIFSNMFHVHDFSQVRNGSGIIGNDFVQSISRHSGTMEN